MRQLLSKINSQTLLVVSSIIAVFFLAAMIQSQLFLNWDVYWLMEASQRLLAGGTYAKNFFENNPPLILYVYIPPVLLAHFLHVSFTWSVWLYVFLLTTLSLILCNFFSQRIFTHDEKYIAPIFILTLAVIFLLLPLAEFGQREHLLVLLSMPYFLMIAYRLEGKVPNRYAAIMIGILGAIGFSIKPYFLFSWVLVELYYLLAKKNFLGWVRPEVLAVIGFEIIYLLVIYVRHPDYLHIIVPFSLRWCYLGVSVPWRWIISLASFIFCLFALLAYLIQLGQTMTRKVDTVLVMSLMGFLLSYLAQQTLFFYHLLPALSVALMLLILFFIRFCYRNNTLIQLLFMTLFALMMLFAFQNYLSLMWLNLLFSPRLFFYFFAGLFILIIYLCCAREKNRFGLHRFVLMLVVMAMAYYIAHLSTYTSTCSYGFFLTFVLLVCGFGLAIPAPSSTKKMHYMYAAVLGTGIFSYPCFSNFNNYAHLVSKEAYQPLITFLNKNALHESVYFFAADSILFALNETKDTKLASRFSALWMVPGLVKQSYLPINNFRLVYQKKDKDFLIDMIAEDLMINKPKFVFVDKREQKRYFLFAKPSGKINIPFDYLAYFSQNQRFKMIWQHYHYVTTIENKMIGKGNYYKFEIYKLG